MSTKNIIAGLDIIIRLSKVSEGVASAIQRAQSEGRDITKEEVAEAKASAEESLDDLGKALGM